MSRRPRLFRTAALATAVLLGSALFATGVGISAASATPSTNLNIRLVSASGALVTGAFIDAFPVIDGVVQDGTDEFGDPLYDLEASSVHGKAGSYQIADLPGAGEYTLFLGGTGAKGTSGQWLGGGQTEDFARVITLAAGSNTIDASYAPSGAISGTVKGSAGKGLANICVVLWSFDGTRWNYLDGSDQYCDAETNSKGQYSVNPGAAGSYKVQFEDEDFDYLVRFADGAKDEADSTPLYLTANKSATVNTTLVKGGALSGKLTSNSGPVDAILEPYLLTGTPGSFTAATEVDSEAETDSHGKFDVAALEPGYYSLGYEVFDDFTGDLIPGFLGGTTPLNSTVYTVTAATTTVVPTYDLDDPATSSGIVVATLTDPSGHALNGLADEIFVANASTQQSFPVSSFVGNVYTFRDIPAGDYDVVGFLVSESGFVYGPDSTPVTVGTGTVDVSLQLSYPPDPMTITVDPSIPSGPLTVGVPVTADPGVASDPSAVPTYQWYRMVDGQRQLIRGAQDASYTPVAGDIGDELAVRVTQTLNQTVLGEIYSSEVLTKIATSDSVVDASSVVVSNSVPPSIANPDDAKVGGTLVASGGAWSPSGAKLSYQWLLNGSPNGATGARYTPTPSDFGQEISVEVKADKAGYVESAWTPSDAVEIGTGDAPTTVTAPKVKAKTVGGIHTFTATPGTWSVGGGSFVYDWYLDGTLTQSGPSAVYSTSLPAAVSLTVHYQTTNRSDGTYTVLAAKGVPSTVSAVLYQELAYPSIVVASGDSVPVGHGVSADPTVLLAPDGTAFTETEQLQQMKGATWMNVGHATSGLFVAVPVSALGHTLRVRYVLSNPSYMSVTGATSSFIGGPNNDLDGEGTVVIPSSRPLGGTLTPQVSGYQSGVKHGYQWLSSTDSGATWTQIAKATTTSLTLKAPLAVGNEVELKVTTTLAGSAPTTVYSNTSTVLSNTIHNLTAPSLSATGPLKVGATVSARNGTWDVPGTTYAYLWQSSPDGSTWTAITPTTTKSSYKTVAGDAGNQIRVEVTANRTGYVSSDAVPTDGIGIVADPADSIIAHSVTLAPAFYGQPAAAPDYTTVFTTVGGLAGATVSYQWNLNGKPIKSAKASTYSPALGDIGKKLSVQLTVASGVYGSATFTTPGVTVAKGAAPSFPVFINGTSLPGSTLSADTPVSGKGVTYRWQLSSDGVHFTPITGATGSTLVVPLAAAGQHVKLVVTDSPAGYATGTGSTTTDIGYLGAIQPLSAPSISSPRVGVATTVDTGSWDTSGVGFSYQWYLGDTRIPGATGATFTPLGSDVGGELKVDVTAFRPGYASADQDSNLDSIAVGVTLAPLVHATVAGSVKTCTTLTVAPGTWNVSGIVVSYQWLANDSPIPGATGATYFVAGGDEGTRFSVQLTASAPGYGDGGYTTVQSAAAVAGSGCV